MCEYSSSIVRRDYGVVWFPGIDSHAEILALAGIDDSQPEYMGRDWAKVELRPPRGDRTSDVDGWKLIVDEVTRPDWWDAGHERAVRAAAKHRIAKERGDWLCKRANGDKCWYRGDKLHWDDGAAVECANGDKYWYRDNKLDRDDGPAVECADGSKCWYRGDKLHRDDGAAVEYANGDKYWYRDGHRVSKPEMMAP